jgi:hypothetical protein
LNKRGRVSAAAVEAATAIVDVSRQMPAAAPSELTDGQAEIWRRVVGSMPGNFMTRAAHPILVEYCRHVGRARLLERQIASFGMDASGRWTRTFRPDVEHGGTRNTGDHSLRASTTANPAVTNRRGKSRADDREPQRWAETLGRLTGCAPPRNGAQAPAAGAWCARPCIFVQPDGGLFGRANGKRLPQWAARRDFFLQ